MLTVRRFLLPALIAALAGLQVQCTEKADREYAEMLRQSAQQKFLDGNREGAFEDFRLAIENDPTNSAIHLSRGMARFDMDDLAGAMSDFEKAIELDPKRFLAFYNRGIVRRRQGDTEGALKDFSTAIALKPDHAPSYFNRGLLRSSKGEDQAAIADYGRALELTPKDARTLLVRAPARYRAGDVAGALADFAAAIALNPQNSSAYRSRGNMRLDHQYRLRERDAAELQAAIADFTTAIELAPNDADSYALRGGARRESGDLPGALADGNRAIELNPKISYSYQSRGFTWLARGEVGKAIDDFTKMVELAPTSTFAWSLRGRAHAIQHDWASSLQDYETARRQNPRDLYPALYRWVMQMHLGQDAVGPLRAAVEETAKLPPPARTASGMTQDVAAEAAWVKTMAAHLLGEIDQAALLSAAELTDAEKTRERKCEAWYFAGAVHLGAGRQEEAARCFQECVDTEVRQFVQHQLAVAELAFLKKTEQ